MSEKKQIRAKWADNEGGLYSMQIYPLGWLRVWEASLCGVNWGASVNGIDLGKFSSLDAAKLAAETEAIRICQSIIDSLEDAPDFTAHPR